MITLYDKNLIGVWISNRIWRIEKIIKELDKH